MPTDPAWLRAYLTRNPALRARNPALWAELGGDEVPQPRSIKRYVPPAALPPDILELPFMEEVRTLARQHGWLCFHAYSSRKSEPGFPDLCLLRGTSLIFAELKDAKYQPTLEQTEWLYALEYGGYESYLWRPQDWGKIVERLSRNTKSI